MNKKALLGLALGATTLTTCGTCSRCGFFHSMDVEFDRMQQELNNMRNVFRQLEDFSRNNTQKWQTSRPNNNVKIDQKEGKTIVSIKLGEDITNFDANLKTKKDGYTHEQLVITVKEPRKQKTVIKVKDNKIAVHQRSEASTSTVEEQENRDDEGKQEKQVFYGSEESSYMMTVDYKLNLQDAEVLYDSKEGILTVEIPAVKPEQEDQKIEVKIK